MSDVIAFLRVLSIISLITPWMYSNGLMAIALFGLEGWHALLCLFNQLAELQKKVRSEVSSEYWLRLKCVHPEQQLFDWGMTRLRRPFYGVGCPFAREGDDQLRKKRDAEVCDAYAFSASLHSICFFSGVYIHLSLTFHQVSFFVKTICFTVWVLVRISIYCFYKVLDMMITTIGHRIQWMSDGRPCLQKEIGKGMFALF